MAKTSETKQKKASPVKGIIGWAIFTVIWLLLFQWLLGDYFTYFAAKEKSTVEAYLTDYTWRYEMSDDEYVINANYAYELEGKTYTFSDTQKNARPGYSRFKTGNGTQQGSDKDPEEVRPQSSFTVGIYRTADGTWKTADNRSIRDDIYIILGYFCILALGVYMVIRNVKKLRSVKAKAE